MSVPIARIPLPALPGLKAQERHANRRQYGQAARVCQHFIRENKGNLALLPSTSYETVDPRQTVSSETCSSAKTQEFSSFSLKSGPTSKSWSGPRASGG